ncbi:MAG: hypothetical protein WD049_06075 [Candidatus Paceibacterota bacterium]
MSLNYLQIAAEKAEARKEAERKQFEDSERCRHVFDVSQAAWNNWSQTWHNIALSRRGELLGESGEDELTDALERLVEAVRMTDAVDNLRIAADGFKPDYCDGTASEEEAYAVWVLVKNLQEIVTGKDAREVAQDLLSQDPLPPLFRADSARHLLRIADRWPVTCEHCGKINVPHRFGRDCCVECEPVAVLHKYTMRAARNISAFSLGETQLKGVDDAVRTLNAKMQRVAVDLGLCDESTERWDAGKRLVNWLVGQTAEPYDVIDMLPVAKAIAKATDIASARSKSVKSRPQSSEAMFSVAGLGIEPKFSGPIPPHPFSKADAAKLSALMNGTYDKAAAMAAKQLQDGGAEVHAQTRTDDVKPHADETEQSEASDDDRHPKKKRANMPSRVKANSAYDYALNRIPDAHLMTAPELHAAILKDDEVANMVPENPDTFRHYLNDRGIRLKKGSSKAIGGSVVRQSEI